ILISPLRPSRLVGSTPMVFRLFESFREWAFSARRRKDSKKPSGGLYWKAPGSLAEAAAPARRLQVRSFCASNRCSASSSQSTDPLKSPGLNIEQLTEPQLTAGELISQERYKPCPRKNT